MGWTWYHKPEHHTVKQECDSVLDWSTHDAASGDKHTLLKSAMVGSVYYAAIEHKKADGSHIVFAAIFLTGSNKRDYYDFGYKDMDETVGPYESRCPVGILDLLTPTDSKYANEWRERCRAFHTKKKKKPKVGDTIKLATPIQFSDGRKLDTFTVVEFSKFTRRGSIKRRALRSTENGGLYRLSLDRYDFTVQPAQ